MKLKKLEICGFKSFVDKASIEFPSGISAVVGPNGCGKSNIIDALRWVMGEQSVKQLRGKSMEDVIFSGTNGKPPLNMAEVTLTLANDNGGGPEEYKDFSEIMLTRKLYRSGESGYYINKQPCRLKDVHNVFLGAGIGTKSYAVVQQGNIGAIIDAGPEERRIIIEDAAGITRYKNRKNEALRKVESTNQNLLRVSDIMAEVKRQMSGLKRQAKKAEKFKKYQDQIKTLDVTIALHHHDAFTHQIEQTDGLLKELKDSDLEQSARLKKLDAAVEDIKLKRAQKDQEIGEQKSRQFEMQRTIDRTENDLVHLRADIERLTEEISRITTAREELEEKNKTIDTEIHQVVDQNNGIRKEIETVSSNLEQERKASQRIDEQLISLNQELDASKNQLMNCVAREAKYKNIYQNASNNKENLKRRLHGLQEEENKATKKIDAIKKDEANARETLHSFREEIEGLDNQVHSIQESLNKKSMSLGEQVKRVQTMSLALNELRSRFTALKRMEETYEWYKEGVQAIMKLQSTEHASNGIIALVADTIDPAPDYFSAVEAVLGDYLQYILVQDQETGVRSIDYLQTDGKGRSGFIPVSSIKKKDSSPKEAGDRSKQLLNHVSTTPGFENIAETLLGNVFVANDINEAIEVWNRDNAAQTIVTKSGELILPEGIMIGGGTANGTGILAKKQEVKDLKHQTAQQDDKLKDARKNQESLEVEVRNIETELQKLIERRNKISDNERELEKVHYRLSEDLKYAYRHLEIVRLEGEQLMGEASDLDDQISKYNQAIAETENEVTASQERVTEISNRIDITSSQMNEYSQRIVDLKLNLTALNAKLENSTTNLQRLRAFQEDSINRLNGLSHEISQKKQKRAALEQKIAESEKSLSAMYEDLKRLDQTLENNRADFHAFDEKLKVNDDAINEIEGKRQGILENIRLLELEQSQRQLRRENIVHQLDDRYHTSLSELRANTSASPEKPIEEMESALSKLRHRISLINDVNLGAIKEYEVLKERYDFLAAQHEDLVKAIDDLHKVIRRINRITRERFLETFHLINEKLNEVFPRLFEGGSARLALTEPDNPLETGVEFMIHPPGKKLTRLSLLSGGEKALSAIALVFSIFLIKPTTFCLLDEIDAPLDDVNVFRFNNLLQLIGEKSQIIMITHNKRTMEFADTLYGVTMENKGVSKIVSVNLNQTGSPK